MITSEQLIIRHVQEISFSSEMSSLAKSEHVSRSSRLYKLGPLLNSDGLLVVHGRLSDASLSDVRKHPVIVPHDHVAASLIVRDIHGCAHLGQEWVVSLVRVRFWITNLRSVVKHVARNCVICKRRFGQPSHQLMADLPESRVQPHLPAFFDIGLDCFGPYFVKYGRAQVKRYGCVFTCFTTRAVHIEKLSTLSSDSLINSLRRFIARRGCPRSIYSDNGTNLTGAYNELKLALKTLDQCALGSFCLSNEINWNFTPPQSSHMGGVYEIMIRTIR